MYSSGTSTRSFLWHKHEKYRAQWMARLIAHSVNAWLFTFGWNSSGPVIPANTVTTGLHQVCEIPRRFLDCFQLMDSSTWIPPTKATKHSIEASDVISSVVPTDQLVYTFDVTCILWLFFTTSDMTWPSSAILKLNCSWMCRLYLPVKL